MMNFVYTLCSSTPGQIQYGGFKRALAKKSGDMIRDRVRIPYLLFLWSTLPFQGGVILSTFVLDLGFGTYAMLTAMVIYPKTVEIISGK